MNPKWHYIIGHTRTPNYNLSAGSNYALHRVRVYTNVSSIFNPHTRDSKGSRSGIVFNEGRRRRATTITTVVAATATPLVGLRMIKFRIYNNMIHTRAWVFCKSDRRERRDFVCQLFLRYRERIVTVDGRCSFSNLCREAEKGTEARFHDESRLLIQTTSLFECNYGRKLRCRLWNSYTFTKRAFSEAVSFKSTARECVLVHL